MLSLTRRLHEEIVVAPTGYRGNQIRVGIKAPERFRIVRRELLERERPEEVA